jgi:uncharacterized protein with FMN-binding domain
MGPTGNNRNKQIITALAVLIAIALIVFATIQATKKKEETASTDTKTTTSQAKTVDNSVSNEGNTSPYKNGTYSASAQYTSPGGVEGVELTVTLKNGSVTESELKTEPAASESREYQAKFQSGYKDQVVGKPVDSINLSRVSGSSLTSGGFNDALAQIKEQAKSQS